MSRRTLKVVIIGDGSAGKTSLRSRYLNDTYHPAYRSTIGADFISKTIEVDVPMPVYPPRKASESRGEASTSSAAQQFRSEKIRITLSIWDTAGQERFKSLGTAFYRGSDAVIIAFDLTAKGALARTLNWYNDFSRLGDIGYEDDKMNSRQLKIAREQRERFCWVGVGCKGDLLEGLQQRQKDSTDEEQWKGVSWTEARGWFDTMIPRYLPEGEEEKQGYPNYDTHQDSNEEAAASYTLRRLEAPARPEDVLSRPEKRSISSKDGNGHVEQRASLGRPSEAGPPPGTAPTPGNALKMLQQSQSPRKSQIRNESKGRRLNGKRKSIRSIDIWQGDQRDGLYSDDTAASSSSAAPIQKGSGSFKGGSHRGRYDSAISTGAPSIYYSIRGSTIQSHNSTGSRSSPSDSSGLTAKIRNGSLSSQDTRTRKQSILSESVTNDEDEDSHDTKTEREETSHKSSETIKEAGVQKNETMNESETESSDDFSFIPTIPSGDPIPFPLHDEFEDDEEEVDMILRKGASLRSKSRSVSRSFSRKDPTLEEGQVGRQTKAIAKETHKLQEEEYEEETEENKRATLFSARPSSISSTIKPDESDAEDDDIPNPGEVYRDQMMEQGFRLFFTSAKEGKGIDAVFEHIAKRVAMKWKLEEWEELAEAERLGGRSSKNGQIRTAPPTDEEVEREMVKRAIKISSGKGTGNCCS